jgi:hypothetical protein
VVAIPEVHSIRDFIGRVHQAEYNAARSFALHVSSPSHSYWLQAPGWLAKLSAQLCTALAIRARRIAA